MAELPDKIRLEIYDAIFRYVESGDEGNLSPEAAAAFAFVKTDIDMEVDKAITKCEKMRENVLKRWNRKDADGQL